MTRLKQTDISDSPGNLQHYEHHLLEGTGHTLLGVACHGYGGVEQEIRERLEEFTITAVPITSGLGRITGFSETVVAILSFLGCRATVTEKTDTAGLAEAYTNGADAVFMADDFHYIGINLHSRKTVDNNTATGYGFAAALDLLTPSKKSALVMGCGSVGYAGAERLLHFGFNTTIFDTNISAAYQMRNNLSAAHPKRDIVVSTDCDSALSASDSIFEATPAASTIDSCHLNAAKAVVAPGVPSGLTPEGHTILGCRAVHDKLELGTASMAVALLL